MRDELRELILSAAEEIIGEAGGGALTARAIAERIGYSPGTIYNFFKDLNDLIMHVNARMLDALYAVCVRVPTYATPEETLRAYARAYLRFTERHQRRWAMLLSDRSPPLPDLPDWYQHKVGRLLRLVEEAIAPLFPQNRRRDQQRAAHILWASIHGIASLASIRAVTGKPTDLINDLVLSYVLGLRARWDPGGGPLQRKSSDQTS